MDGPSTRARRELRAIVDFPMADPDKKDSEAKGAFVVAGHEVLFTPQTDAPRGSDAEERCDACGEPIPPPSEDDDDSGYAIGGRGRYVWARGDERRAEEPPLCPSCAAAIGMVALQHLGMEDDEG